MSDLDTLVSANIGPIVGLLVVALVVLVFLQNWRATLVPATTVPVTIIGAFADMLALGFSINLMTLFALILAIGIVVDNAIVIVDRDLGDADIKRISTKLGIKDAVILGSSGVLNNRPLHFPNEPARHKLLDVMGDLALIGVPLKAQILAARPGHASNIVFARMVRKLYQQKKLIRRYQHERKEGVVFDINAIKKILPHRYPFLLIDKIIEFQMDEKIVGVKNVTANEPFFEGHFPGRPVMPGVLILEGMGQTGGILLLNGIENPGDKLVFFMAINNAKFRKPVLPGDQLVFELTMVSRKSRICQMKGLAFVDGTLVAEAELLASIVPRAEGPQEAAGGNGGQSNPLSRSTPTIN